MNETTGLVVRIVSFDVASGYSFDALRERQEVEFEVERGEKGPRAVNVRANAARIGPSYSKRRSSRTRANQIEPAPSSARHTEHVAGSEIEKRYIRFCVDNRLYLHPCPVSSHEAYQDPLSVCFSAGTNHEYLEMPSNQLALIKQEPPKSELQANPKTGSHL
jgi:hypothetical protein